MKFSTKRSSSLVLPGFTLREVLIIVVVVSVGLLSVIVVLTDGMKYVQKTRQKIVALNLAREGMEGIYQIRDTNWTRRSGFENTCRLKLDPLSDDGQDCQNDLRISSGAYVLQRLYTGEQEYFALTGPLAPQVNLSNGLDTGDLQFSLCQQSGFWDACIGEASSAPEGKYFRQIEGLGLYLKNNTTGGEAILCTGSSAPACGTSSAQEFRFCSKVVYVGETIGEVKLCGVITNFKN